MQALCIYNRYIECYSVVKLLVNNYRVSLFGKCRLFNTHAFQRHLRKYRGVEKSAGWIFFWHLFSFFKLHRYHVQLIGIFAENASMLWLLICLLNMEEHVMSCSFTYWTWRFIFYIIDRGDGQQLFNLYSPLFHFILTFI